MHADKPLHGAKPDRLRPTTLTASGIRDVAPRALAWVDEVCLAVRRGIGDGPVRMHVRAYRHHGQEHLSCDFSGAGEETWYMMTFIIDDTIRLHPSESRVPDVTEALFLVGLLAERLEAATLLDVTRR